MTGAQQLTYPEWATQNEILGHCLPVYLIHVLFFFFSHSVLGDDFCY